MRYIRVRTSAPDCAARWAFPAGAEPGQYSLFIRIPSSHATSEGARYSIHHAGGVTGVVINQVVFPNQFYVTDGWVYAGRYEFAGRGGEYVELTNLTQDEPAVAESLEVGADAVRFVPVIEPTPTAIVTRTGVDLAEETFTPTPALPSPSAPTVTGTATITQTPPATLTPEFVLVDVYFVDQYRLDRNLKPFERAGIRWSKSNRLARTVLDEYFRGPGATESTEYGWIGIYNGFTGYRKLEVTDGVARVYLKGACDSGGATYTIADVLNVNLKQFDDIQFVKIYDQNGETQDPEGYSDSIPACLEP